MAIEQQATLIFLGPHFPCLISYLQDIFPWPLIILLPILTTLCLLFRTLFSSPSLISPDDSLISINVAAQAPIKLIVENYTIWYSQWFSLLFGHSLMGYVDGTKPYLLPMILFCHQSRSIISSKITFYFVPY